MGPRFRPFPGGCWFPLVLFGFMAVVGAGVFLTSLGDDAGSRPPLAFALLWWAALLWNGYWFLWRIAGELWVEGTTLHWKAPFRSGAVDVSEIVEIRPMRLASGIEVIVLRHDRSILTFTIKGVRELNEAIQRVRPEIPARIGWSARWDERFRLGRSRFR